MGPPANDRRLWNFAVLSLVFAAAANIVSLTVADPDLWGHVLFGMDLLRSGKIPATDPFSYTSAGHPWINHELLSEVAFGAAYGHGGTVGLMLLKMAIGLTIATLAYRHLRGVGLPALRAGIVLIAVLFAMRPALGTIRPQLLTLLFFLLTLLILDAAEKGRARRLWLLPPLFAVWINVHGGVLAGLAVLALWSGAHLSLSFRKDSSPDDGPSRRTIAAVLAASLLATLINPYGADLPLFLLKTATVARYDIAEWHALELRSAAGALYLLLLATAAVVLVKSRAERRPAPLLVLACTALLPLFARRHLALFALSFAVYLADHLSSIWAGAAPSADESAEGESRRAALLQRATAGTTFVMALLFFGMTLPRMSCIPIRPRASMGFPLRAVSLLREAGVEGHLAVHFNYGEYVIWHLSPAVRVSMDGRRETVYPDSVYQEALRFQTGVGVWDDVLRKRETDMALVPKSTPTYNLLSLDPAWTAAYGDTLVGLFVREGWAGADRLDGVTPPPLPGDGAGSCFP